MNEPAESRGAARADASSPLTSAPRPTSSTVLLVDDEPSVRRLTETVLRSRGYHVVSAANGDEALALLERPEAADYAVLVTDVVMPGLGGFDVASRFLATHPRARVVLMSGSITADEVCATRFGGRADFLAKPFRATALLARVEDAFARASAAPTRAA